METPLSSMSCPTRASSRPRCLGEHTGGEATQHTGRRAILNEALFCGIVSAVYYPASEPTAVPAAADHCASAGGPAASAAAVTR